MIRIENIMLKKYLPKLILKSRFGFIKKDDSIGRNFDLIFDKNNFYKNYRYYFISDNLYGSFILSVMLLANLLKHKN